MTTRDHWDSAYSARDFQQQSWFQGNPERSLAMIARSGISREESLIDVGGGASLLVDYLLNDGYRDITVLDISTVALDEARKRLGDKASSVQWLRQDVLTFIPGKEYRLWHDRAVFHFLTGSQDQQLYIDVLRCALSPGGQLIIAAFAPDGPDRCSGLPVMQHDAASLERILGPGFELQEQVMEDHRTPAGKVQRFGYYRFARD